MTLSTGSKQGPPTTGRSFPVTSGQGVRPALSGSRRTPAPGLSGRCVVRVEDGYVFSKVKTSLSITTSRPRMETQFSKNVIHCRP